jgi:NAD(P)-dependent dehydrogenase (short-subunit alcohol dehydrogenase family)
VFAVNVTSVMRLTRAVLPMMLAAGGGAIVNVSSEASLRASASGVAYTASKHAVNGITKSTAVFYKGNGIRANAVAPGPVATNIQAPFKSEHAAGVLGPIMQTTIPSVASAEQLAATICWLLSDDASNVNGVILPSDGGVVGYLRAQQRPNVPGCSIRESGCRSPRVGWRGSGNRPRTMD